MAKHLSERVLDERRARNRGQALCDFFLEITNKAGEEVFFHNNMLVGLSITRNLIDPSKQGGMSKDRVQPAMAEWAEVLSEGEAEAWVARGKRTNGITMKRLLDKSPYEVRAQQKCSDWLDGCGGYVNYKGAMPLHLRLLPKDEADEYRKR